MEHLFNNCSIENYGKVMYSDSGLKSFIEFLKRENSLESINVWTKVLVFFVIFYYSDTAVIIVSG
jgi:hypothetical protein